MRPRWLRKLRGTLQADVPGLITCREVEAFIEDYVHGTLPWLERWVFRLHLLYCRECRDFLASYERAVAIGKAVFRHPDELVPSEMPEDFVRAILSARRRSSRS